jgi:hypothetical protein
MQLSWTSRLENANSYYRNRVVPKILRREQILSDLADAVGMQRAKRVTFSNGRVFDCDMAILGAGASHNDDRHRSRNAKAFEETNCAANVCFHGLKRSAQGYSWKTLCGEVKDAVRPERRQQLRQARGVSHIAPFESVVRPCLLWFATIDPEDRGARFCAMPYKKSTDEACSPRNQHLHARCPSWAERVPPASAPAKVTCALS